MNDDDYICILAEIFDGYSEVSLGDQPVFIKHFLLKDQKNLEKLQKKHLKHALKKGLPEKQSVLDLLKEQGMWSEKEESQIGLKKDELENLKITQKNLPLISQRDEAGERIKEVAQEIDTLERKKYELMGLTAEQYAENRSNNDFLSKFLFKDPELKTLVYTQDEFDELTTEDLLEIQKLRLEIHNRLGDNNIQTLILKPFFNIYISMCEDPLSFYGSPAVDLSISQLKLLAFGRMFYNIFLNTENIPDNIREDPKKLLSFAEAQRNKTSNKMLKEDADASAVFGATKEDMKELTGSEKTGGTHLNDVLKEKGGKLSMEDMMKLSGHE